ncbi:MAG: hypothetical protein ACKVJU_13545 [Verrucomicrobiales bacterium]
MHAFFPHFRQPKIAQALIFILCLGSTASANDAELMKLLRQEEARPPLEARITERAPDPAAPIAARPTVAPPVPKKKFFSRTIDGASIEDQRRQLGSGAIPGPKLPTEEPQVKPIETPSWQTKYLVGPGDSLNISIYNRS